jgi:hypothetical protein
VSSNDTEKQSKYPAARLRGLTPYKPGQCGNPGGMPKGVVYVTSALRRLMKMGPIELSQFQPQNAAEVMAMRLIYSSMYSLDALPAIKEIIDRTEGKALQRKADVTADEIGQRARVMKATAQQVRDSLVGKVEAELREIQRTPARAVELLDELLISLSAPDEDLIAAVLSAFGDNEREAAARALEEMA